MTPMGMALLRNLAARKGHKRPVRSMKHPAFGAPKHKTIVRMNGMNGLGHVSPQALVREAEVACRMLKMAHAKFLSKEWHPAIDAYFKASAIATNVIFTANVHDLKLPEALIDDMNCIISDGTEGIKRVMKVVATKGLIHHEKNFHKGQSKAASKKGAAAFMRQLMKGKRK